MAQTIRGSSSKINVLRRRGIGGGRRGGRRRGRGIRGGRREAGLLAGLVQLVEIGKCECNEFLSDGSWEEFRNVPYGSNSLGNILTSGFPKPK